MTWNVENLFVPGAEHQADYEAKLDALAAVISDARPDLLAVQEVGDPESFEALRGRLGGGWTGVLATHFEPSTPSASVGCPRAALRTWRRSPTTESTLSQLGRGAREQDLPRAESVGRRGW